MKKGWKKYLATAGMLIVSAFFIYIIIETVRAQNTGFETKTLWDWMELLIVPLVLAGGVFYLNRSERNVERQIADNRAKLEREIATDRQQETALQSYFDRMAELLLTQNLLISDDEEVRNVARIRTLTVLQGLDENRKKYILLFLHEAGLITKGKSIINMFNANLSRVNLSGANLSQMNWMNTYPEGAGSRHIDLEGADLSNAVLSNTNLSQIKLSHANLRSADLHRALLLGADLSQADLRGANLRHAGLEFANLGGADLRDADLEGANLTRLIVNAQDFPVEKAILGYAEQENANLYNADLSNANLNGAKVTDKQLASAKSLKGAIMPDGTKHE